MGSNRNNTNIIDINGKRYDAVTGTYLGKSVEALPKANVHTVRSGSPRSVDGFTRVSRGQTPAPLAPQTPHMRTIKSIPKQVSNPKPFTTDVDFITTPTHHITHQTVHHTKPVEAVKQAVVRAAHTPGIDVAPHSQQRATTLMRSAVTKPVIKSPAMIKAQTRTDLLATAPMQLVKPKMSYNTVNPVRHRRAERMIQSPAISRYGSGNNLAAQTQTVYAISAPQQPIARPLPQPASNGRNMNGFTPRQTSTNRGTVTRPAAHGTTQSNPAAPAVARGTHEDIFERALADAKSHEQTYQGDRKHHKVKRRSRILRYVTGSLVALLLVGFLAYHNSPSLSLAVASYKSGLHAKLPAKQPSGFSLGYLDYQPGDVTLNFTSPEDSRQFNIKQKASNWDSQALLSNFVATANSAYKTYQRAGRTVYLVGNNTATWVDSGVWYTVDGNSSLSSTQLLDLASNM